MADLVSVILCVYNREEYLKEAIGSVLAQDYPKIELIIVNDGSTTDVKSIIDSYGSLITYIYQENQGLGVARNTGIKYAKGDYLAFIDSDDLWTKNKLSLQMAHIKPSHLNFSYVKQFICPTLSKHERQKLIVKTEPLPGYNAGTLLVSKKLFHSIGPFFEENQVGDFLDWFIRAKQLNTPLQMLPEITYYRRIHLTNMSRQTEIFSKQGFLKVLRNGLHRERNAVSS